MTYIGIGAVLCAFALLQMGVMRTAHSMGAKLPSVQSFQDFVTVFNTKGGLVCVLLGMWVFTLSGTVVFGVWVITKGIDPQQAVVVTLLGMLVSQAFGNVNGALFTALKGEDPKSPAGVSRETVKTESTSSTVEPSAPLTHKS